jgi:hypothetical protein
VRTVVTRVLATLDGRRSRPSSAYGYGAIDAYRAVTASVPSDAANPVFSAADPFRDRDAALAASSLGRAPQPAGHPGSPVGDYAVGSSGLTSPQVAAGLALGAAGLLLLAVLLAAGARGRRRRRRQVVEVGLPPWPPPPPPPPPMGPPSW